MNAESKAGQPEDTLPADSGRVEAASSETNDVEPAVPAAKPKAAAALPETEAAEPEVPAEEPAPPPAPVLTPQERREKAITDAMRTAIRDYFLDRYNADTEKLGTIDFDFSMTMNPAEDWKLSFDPPLEQQVLHQLEDGEARYSSYVEGRAFCFKCESAACEHSTPPTPLSVFGRYDSTGTPTWVDFSQKLVDTQHPDVDKLFTPKPPVLNLMQFGKELKEGQLSSFGRASKTYAILGQVSLGYLLLPKGKGNKQLSDRRLAITFQIVETRGRGGRFDLRLNTLIAPGVVDDPAELFDGDWLPWLRRARVMAREQLAQIQGQATYAREEHNTKQFQEHMSKIGSVLRKLSRSLTRSDRQAKRRTKHSEERRQESARPTDKAYEDARRVQTQHLYWEEGNSTWVVYHPHGRAHIFGENGKHVTTFQIKPDAHDRRLRMGRWKKTNGMQVEEFRAALGA